MVHADCSAILQAEGFLLYLYGPLIVTLLRVQVCVAMWAEMHGIQTIKNSININGSWLITSTICHKTEIKSIICFMRQLSYKHYWFSHFIGNIDMNKAIDMFASLRHMIWLLDDIISPRQITVSSFTSNSSHNNNRMYEDFWANDTTNMLCIVKISGFLIFCW